jgi:cytochrome c oxidase subunit IV/cytochrome c551/c552
MNQEKNLPMGTYLKVWGTIVVLVTLSYVIFLLGIEPLWLRRLLFVAIALTQAVLSVNYFMQMRLERPSLVYGILLPATLLLALVIFAISEGKYVTGVRQAEYSVAGAEKQMGETPKPHNEEGPSTTPTEDAVEKGKQLAQANGCLGCHSLNGRTLVGPTWLGLYGSQRELQDGSTVTADEAYVRESIVNPAAKVVKGFQPIMPPFSFLKDEQIQALVAYIKSLSHPAK